MTAGIRLTGQTLIVSDPSPFKCNLVKSRLHLLYQVYDDFLIGPLKEFTLHVGHSHGTAGMINTAGS